MDTCCVVCPGSICSWMKPPGSLSCAHLVSLKVWVKPLYVAGTTDEGSVSCWGVIPAAPTIPDGSTVEVAILWGRFAQNIPHTVVLSLWQFIICWHRTTIHKQNTNNNQNLHHHDVCKKIDLTLTHCGCQRTEQVCYVTNRNYKCECKCASAKQEYCSCRFPYNRSVTFEWLLKTTKCFAVHFASILSQLPAW